MGDLIGNKIAGKIVEVSKCSLQNNLKTVELETEISNKRYISSGKIQQIIDGLKLI